jgi:transcriptional antiterminator RfaH
MNSGTLDDRALWYAVRTKSKQEDRADINLRIWNVQTFIPKIREFCTSGYGDRYEVKPLFSRYIFAHFDANRQLQKVNYTRGVQKVVSFGDGPVSLDERIIDLIKTQIGEEGFIRIDDQPKPGDKVRINSGPFESLSGIFKRNLSSTDRVEILLNTITYQSHLVIDKEMVEKVS